MAAPPSKRLLSTDDIPGAPEWLEKLVAPLNAFIRVTASALDRGVTFSQQFAGEVKTLTVTPPDEWTPATFGTGWAQWVDADYPPVALRKDLFGNVEMRGLADNTGAGTRIVTLDSAHAPASGHFSILPNAANDAPAGVIVRPEGVDLLFGSVLTWVSLAGLRWVAADRTPPRWAKPVDVRLGAPDRPFPGRPGQVIVLACRQLADATAPAPVVWVDWTVAALEQSQGVRIHRVWGLEPGVAYSLTMLVLPE